MIRSLAVLITVIVIGAGSCFAADLRLGRKTNSSPVIAKFERMSKPMLQEELKLLQKQVLEMERKAVWARSTAKKANAAYEFASDSQKPTALLRMLDAKAAETKADKINNEMQRQFSTAKEVYLERLSKE